VVDKARRKSIGRPWLSVALDIASRCVLGIYLAMERPNAATVALLLTRVVLPKAGWLASIGVAENKSATDMPMNLSIDDAAQT